MMLETDTRLPGERRLKDSWTGHGHRPIVASGPHQPPFHRSEL